MFSFYNKWHYGIYLIVGELPAVKYWNSILTITCMPAVFDIIQQNNLTGILELHIEMMSTLELNFSIQTHYSTCIHNTAVSINLWLYLAEKKSRSCHQKLAPRIPALICLSTWPGVMMIMEYCQAIGRNRGFSWLFC